MTSIGAAGQEKISQATVLVAGCGALGSYVAEQLTRAGVAHLILVDPDQVSLTNLQRQALFDEDDVNQHRLKVMAAKNHLNQINHEVEITPLPAPLSIDLLNELDFDLVIDCLDNYQARDLINQAAWVHQFSYVFGSCAGNFGNVMLIDPSKGPCLNDVFPDLEALKATDCDLIGVTTPLVPLVAANQVSLALHYLVDPATVNYDRLLTIDAWNGDFNYFRVQKRPDCPVCANHKLTVEPDVSPQVRVLCGSQTYLMDLTERLDLNDLADWLTDRQIEVEQSPKFIHFTFNQNELSAFKNGRLILYGAPDLADAENQFDRFLAVTNHLMTQ
ncbi:HesA/MoeB/ThiF family protein [Limosilactobacillus fermentum]|uniref:HesA/MoeB/ThiF family protein n=1 Tax=Limosilactobacillus fermentum TaxID=1613 RepID=UPI0004222475|nr:HesA/MoeB/ThiF family protein [Limosilactobacillus fermentum]